MYEEKAAAPFKRYASLFWENLLLGVVLCLASRMRAPPVHCRFPHRQTGGAKALKESLKLLCDAFSFDCGLVYGMDQQRCFQLKECCTLRDVPLRELFALEDIEPGMPRPVGGGNRVLHGCG